MKRKLLLLFHPACICFVVACAMQDKNEWEEEVAGTYVAQYEQSYSTGSDTLFITKMKNAPGSFHIQRHTNYQRKEATETGERFFKTDNWRGVADKTQPLLHIMPSGRELWFNAAKEEMTTGTTTYHRLK